MSGLPHQVQRKMDIIVDSADLTTYVKVPGLRSYRYTRVKLEDLIRVSAKRHTWRVEIQQQIDWLCGDDDE